MIQTLKETAPGRLLRGWYHLLVIKKRGSRRLTHANFQALKQRFGSDSAALSRYIHDHFTCRVIIDSNVARILKKLKADFNLRNFVETGTYDGESTLAMTLLFERVFTCDVKDWKRRSEFYFADNLIYETKTSPDFLRAHLPEIRSQSLFYLDAHWGAYWPLKEELEIVFSRCENPVVVIDDFDAGNGLYFDQYGDQKLGFDYLAGNVPPDYKFCMNPRSHRNRGMIFIFPPSANYGCRFAERDRYDEKTHGLWDKLKD